MKARVDTIAAIATPPGAGGVAVIRMSGPDARTIVESIFRRQGGGDGMPEVRRVYVGWLHERSDGGVVDQVLGFWMQGPHSYTGEDVVEIQCHGGSLVSQRVLATVCAAGARPAEPGEFTKRAFLNGRLDLAQAEAVADLIAAQSESARRLAWSQLDGLLSSRVEQLREVLVQARARCEVELDFSDEDVPELASDEVGRQVTSVRVELERLLQSFARNQLRYQGARVALIGRPNVGKSSLLNALAGRDRALVTAVPGTTRDVVEASIVVEGCTIVLMDTAGLRSSDDLVESMGVARSHAAIDDASCVVAVFDRSSPLSTEDENVAAVVRGRNTVAVLNKADLPAGFASDEVKALVGAVPMVEVSAVTGSGLAVLASLLHGRVFGADDGTNTEEIAIFRVRHYEAVRRAVDDLVRAEAAVAQNLPLELVASDLASAASALGDITGMMSSEDVLDRVFADFCLGK